MNFHIISATQHWFLSASETCLMLYGTQFGEAILQCYNELLSNLNPTFEFVSPEESGSILKSDQCKPCLDNMLWQETGEQRNIQN